MTSRVPAPVPGSAPIEAVGVTMPLWPGAEEAEFAAGIWEPMAGG